MKWLVGNIKLALMHPTSDKMAKRNVAVWSVLLMVVVMNLLLALFLGTGWGFSAGFSLMGMIMYAPCLRWAILGLQYRARENRLASDRAAFDALVKGL